MHKITNDILASYIVCRYKAYLKISIEHDVPVDGNHPEIEMTLGHRLTPPGEILPGSLHASSISSNEITLAALRRGETSVDNGLLTTESVSLLLGLRKALEAPSDIGNFHYLPVLTCTKYQPSKMSKLLLEVYALVLSGFQGRVPDKGIISRPEGKSSTVLLTRGLKRGAELLRALAGMRETGQPPALMLNEHCPHCEFKNRCRAQALEEDNLTLLRGISAAEVMRLRRRGIFTVNQLSYTFRPKRAKKRAKNPARPHYFSLQALAIREQKVFVHGTPALTLSDTRIYMDFEGVPEDQSYYLVGLMVVRAGTAERRSFWANDKHDEAQIFIDMLDLLKDYQNCSVLHFGAYEIRALRRMQRRLPLEYKAQIERLIKHSVNVLAIVGQHIYFPVFSNDLKEIGKYLGYKWSNAEASGAQSIIWRRKWRETQDTDIKEEIIRYNMDDCAALEKLVRFLEVITQHGPSSAKENGDFAHTDLLEPEPGGRGKFQQQQFALSEFADINRCSYFDYQHERMSARNRSRTVRNTAPKLKRKTPKYQINKIVEVFCSRCPSCRSKRLTSVRLLRRHIVDLKFSGVAVRRWIVLYLSREYSCQKCRTRFIPDGFPLNRTQFGRGLLSWCMYQIVVGGQNMSRVQDGLVHLFGIKLDISTLYRFKGSVSDHYSDLRHRILERLLSGQVLYIDETPVNLRSKAGYVWCMSDGRSVYYFYKESREGSFLPEMLRGFQGVLVSDFYTAYDSVECRQQRCLVHLMRDFNEELQRHPFDEELKMLASRFSTVLRDAVSTIDKYGYKARHLRKHKKPANAFCEWVSKCDFCSPEADRLRCRIHKYRDKLFTFLDCDSVSWNNTNAEHFIKPLARYRRTANGIFTERSIQDYLVILTVAETCRGCGDDFLKFLLRDSTCDFSYKPRRRASDMAASGARSMSLPSASEPGHAVILG